MQLQDAWKMVTQLIKVYLPLKFAKKEKDFLPAPYVFPYMKKNRCSVKPMALETW